MRKLSREEKIFVKALLKMYISNGWCKPSEYAVYQMLDWRVDRDLLEEFIDKEWLTLNQ